MGYKHVTSSGKVIKLKEISDRHLLNIIKYQKRKANEGTTICCNEGTTIYYSDGYDACDMWHEEYTIYGEEVLRFFNHKKYIKEAKKRNLID